MEEVMPQRSLDAFTRRASLVSLGAAALAAAATPFRTEAKKNQRKSKSANRREQECQLDLAVCTTQGANCATQVTECTAFLTTICGSEPECQPAIACCSFLASCDVASFVTCLADAQETQ
jgi:hypothetical protein